MVAFRCCLWEGGGELVELGVRRCGVMFLEVQGLVRRAESKFEPHPSLFTVRIQGKALHTGWITRLQY